MSIDPQKMMKMAAQMQGNGDLIGIEIDPQAVDPEEVELLQDMVLAAVTEAFRQAAALQQERMGAITGGLGGLGLPGL